MDTEKYNVVVVGGGPAGVAAAIAAARNGSRVLLIERIYRGKNSITGNDVPGRKT